MKHFSSDQSFMTEKQLKSISLLPTTKKYSFYERVTLENRSNYFAISTYPIIKQAEDDMELVSDIITWGERFLNCWEAGNY